MILRWRQAMSQTACRYIFRDECSYWFFGYVYIPWDGKFVMTLRDSQLSGRNSLFFSTNPILRQYIFNEITKGVAQDKPLY